MLLSLVSFAFSGVDSDLAGVKERLFFSSSSYRYQKRQPVLLNSPAFVATRREERRDEVEEKRKTERESFTQRGEEDTNRVKSCSIEEKEISLKRGSPAFL